ncbi:hypothetical protein HDV00_005258 [Rhizophlyctis rosea]|nr:hypothetical protein HDV00_005258 [Rhizophlyctis rosea]
MGAGIGPSPAPSSRYGVSGPSRIGKVVDTTPKPIPPTPSTAGTARKRDRDREKEREAIFATPKTPTHRRAPLNGNISAERTPLDTRILQRKADTASFTPESLKNTTITPARSLKFGTPDRRTPQRDQENVPPPVKPAMQQNAQGQMQERRAAAAPTNPEEIAAVWKERMKTSVFHLDIYDKDLKKRVEAQLKKLNAVGV